MKDRQKGNMMAKSIFKNLHEFNVEMCIPYNIS
jgi:hypothetical protein